MPAKIVVLYPRPADVTAFERVYADEHVPMVPRFTGITRFVQTRVVGTPSGETPPFHRLAELHFPSMEVLKSAASSQGAQQAVAHAVSISTGGAPVFLVCEETTNDF
ncbi:MAG: EthD family reductase [Gemmatimonadota bacterium]